MWSLLKFLLDLVVCVVWYGAKAVLFVICALCWGVFCIALPAALFVLTLGAVDVFPRTYDRAGKEHRW